MCFLISFNMIYCESQRSGELPKEKLKGCWAELEERAHKGTRLTEFSLHCHLEPCLLAYVHQASLNCLAPELYLLCPMCTPLNCLVQLYLTCTHSRSQPRLFAIRCPSYSHFGNFNLSTVTLVLFIWIWQKWNHLPHFVETSLILFQSWQECTTTTTSQRW